VSVQKEGSNLPEDLASDFDITVLEIRADKGFSFVGFASSDASLGLRELNGERVAGINGLLGDWGIEGAAKDRRSDTGCESPICLRGYLDAFAAEVGLEERLLCLIVLAADVCPMVGDPIIGRLIERLFPSGVAGF